LEITTNQSLKFTPITYASTIDVNLVWDDFTNFYAIISYNETLESYAFLKYPRLTYFLKSWDKYKMLNFIPLVSFDQTLPSCWRLGLGGKRLPQCITYLVGNKMDYRNKQQWITKHST
jgi:hypothetical protein